MHNRIFAVLLVLITVFSCAVNASAVEMPDLTQKGSLTFAMESGGELLDGGSLNLYRIASLDSVTEDRYDFRLREELSEAGATLDTDALWDGAQAERLLAQSKDALKEQYLSAPIIVGQAEFTDLEVGLYLVWQGSEDVTEGYAAISPFLISLPQWHDGVYEFDLEASPKVPFVPTPPPPPTEPPPSPPPELPQTGQLKWPVAAMAVSGSLLLMLGLILCAGRRRCGREK